MAFATAVQPYPSLCTATILGTLSKDISPKDGQQLQLRSSLVGRRHLGGCRAAEFRTWVGADSGWRVKCWFKFGKRGMDAEGAGIYGSQKRDDFDRDDVEQYFNYMGMLAVEGSYDKMEALLNKNIHPVDILLLLAASEGDRPKIEELMRAGADCTVTDTEGRTALDRAVNDDIKNLILNFPK